jgi:hypothetical protein
LAFAKLCCHLIAVRFVRPHNTVRIFDAPLPVAASAVAAWWMPELQQQRSATAFAHDDHRAAGHHRGLPERQRPTLLISAADER